MNRWVLPGNANLRIGKLENASWETGVPGPVWHREYWDRFIRDNRHFQQAAQYIHQNPVKAGLVEKAEDWPWSSARFGKKKDANREMGVPGVRR